MWERKGKVSAVFTTSASSWRRAGMRRQMEQAGAVRLTPLDAAGRRGHSGRVSARPG